MENYLSILLCLLKANVKFIVIGTWAIKALFPKKMKPYKIQDCDIVLLPTIENIRKAVATLKEENWEISVWGVPISCDVEEIFLQNKFYIRATKDNLILDMTYECALVWDILEENISTFKKIPLASIKNLLKLKHKKAKENNTIPTFKEFLGILFGK